MVRKFFRLDALFVEPGVKTGIAIHTDNPAEVGADRIVNCVAAHAEYGGPAIIVDFGTATTFDGGTHDARYIGGGVPPGVTISAQAPFARAGRPPRVGIPRPGARIGTHTIVDKQ